MTATGRASGKLILAGEHAVVHGQPALAFAVDLATEVTVQPASGPTQIDAPVHDDALVRAVHTLFGEGGTRVTVRTELPIGRGMGSSAALSVALVRAHQASGADVADVYEAALALERIFHDTPSGVDVAVATYGGVVRFTRGPPRTLTPLPCPHWQAVVIDTGKVGVTSALVAAVTARRPGIDALLRRIGALVDDAVAVLDDAPALGDLLSENHALLKGIGVSTDELDALVALALSHGAHGAKLSGAGGGGVVLALTDDPAPLVAAATARGYAAWTTRPTRPTPPAPAPKAP